jgi:OFA family oxalate/formate antiporter-like MFS transporter
MANWIVNHYGETITVHGVDVNPTGYQCVLYATVVLYIIAFVISIVMVRPTDKALEAKAAKMAAKKDA